MSRDSLLNSECQIYRQSYALDDLNQVIYTDILKSYQPCRWRELNGYEKLSLGKDITTKMVRFYLKPNIDINKNDVIYCKNRKYKITWINILGYQGGLTAGLQVDTEDLGLCIDNCPNDISRIYATIITDSLTFSKYQTVDINGTNSKNHFIELYTGNTNGKHESNKIFYGDEGNITTRYGMVSIIINDATYYLKVYNGNTTSSCCSNIIGTLDT